MTDQLPPKKKTAAVKTRRKIPAGAAGILREDETIKMAAIIHPGIYWKAIAVFILAVFLLLTVFNLGVLMLVVCGLMAVGAWMTKHYLLLVLTDTRVLIRYGVLQLEAIQMNFNRIESVELSWTPMGRALGYSSVMVTGTGSRVSMVPFVANGPALRQEIDRLIAAREDKPIRVEVENTVAVAPPPDSGAATG